MSTSAERADKLIQQIFGRGLADQPEKEEKSKVFKRSLASRMMESRRKQAKLLEPFLPKKGKN